ncbi:MAG TPA: peptide ABC transporter substrate-binding protein [Ktedonobacteraceae bacterium]|nr:peptide ABC transporter substrate-binding protein [Ktedonobacteraceae bacterium]
MNRRKRSARQRRVPLSFVFLSILLLILAACGTTGTTPAKNGTPGLASSQVLTFPNVGIADAASLDPATGPDGNTAQAVGMIYSGLVRSDANLGVIPDQATWQVSSNNTVYTFHLKPNIKFSDGTPVTAQTYVYTLTRQLLPAVNSPIATFFEANIKGASDVASGKTKTLAGVQALDSQTLQITLTRPTPYFLEVMTNSLYYPLNENMINKYGQTQWGNNAVGPGFGTGPFMIKEWDHHVKMVLVPNPYYYGPKTKLTEVDMLFVSDPGTAYRSFEAKQYDFVWNIPPEEQPQAQSQSGFVRKSLLQTDLLFFDNTKPPFNNLAVRQAFAYATNKQLLVQAVFKNAVVAAQTIIPPGMPGYQPNYPGIPYNAAKAKSLLQSVYPDVSKIPQIVFSYPSSQVSENEAAALQQMWQSALGIQVTLHPEELSTYNNDTSEFKIQFGFTQWGADFPDPYDWLTLNLTTNAPNNNGRWSDPQFDQLTTQAEQTTGSARIALYNQAEDVAIQHVGWLPLDHEALAAIIPSYIHGITLNGNGLYFGDWSGVYITQH